MKGPLPNQPKARARRKRRIRKERLTLISLLLRSAQAPRNELYYLAVVSFFTLYLHEEDHILDPDEGGSLVDDEIDPVTLSASLSSGGGRWEHVNAVQVRSAPPVKSTKVTKEVNVGHRESWSFVCLCRGSFNADNPGLWRRVNKKRPC